MPSAGIYSHIFLSHHHATFTGRRAARSPNANVRSMHQLGDIMKLSNLTFIAVALCAGTVNWSISVASADEVLKFRVILHATFIQSQEVGDVDGHTLGLAHYSGLASFADGSVGTTNFTATTDYIKGTGTYSVYYNLTLKDGSALWWKATGPATLEGTTTMFPEAPLSVLRGTAGSKARRATAPRSAPA